MRWPFPGIFLVISVTASGLSQAAVPIPEPAFLEPVPALNDCTPENDYEIHAASIGEYAGTVYGDKCERLKFAFGPIHVKPGQNDVLIEPVTIEKPAYSGYAVRIKPDLVDATGEAPGIEDVHLHHATWLSYYSPNDNYGNGPFFASGEEKTIATFPVGYGMRIDPLDNWLLLYMVHNTGPQPTEVWITYDIDFVKESDAAALGIAKVKPIWLDVQHARIADNAPSTGANPVFNVHRGFGSPDQRSFPQLPDSANWTDGVGTQACSWPRQNCARFDVYGNVTAQQGATPIKDGNPVSLAGADWRVTSDLEGTLIGLGGHLHPGGIRDEVSLVRGGVERPIHISDALYWDRNDPTRAGGPPTSWDFSMTVTGAPLGWKVKIKANDTIRLNAVYDSQIASWYENMGIVVALVAPDDPHAPAGVDVFTDNVTIDPGVPYGAIVPVGARQPSCTPNLTGTAKTLCLRGQITHGHLEEAGEFGGCSGPCAALPTKEWAGDPVTDIFAAGFKFGLADFGALAVTGIPHVKLNETVTFWNFDTAADIWHTITRCKEPCTGATGLDYPIANGGTGPDDLMDFDSTEIGYGIFFSPASGQIGGSKSLSEAARDGLYWEFTPTRTGTYTFYCRIHPSMRGAIEVVE